MKRTAILAFAVTLTSSLPGVSRATTLVAVGKPQAGAQPSVNKLPSEPASASELLSAMSDCVGNVKIGSASGGGQFVKLGWIFLGQGSVNSRSSTSDSYYTKGRIILVLSNINGGLAKTCRILARVQVQSVADTVVEQAIERFKVAHLSSESAVIKRNKGLTVDTARSILENHDIILRVKTEADKDSAELGLFGYINIVVAPNA